MITESLGFIQKPQKKLWMQQHDIVFSSKKIIDPQRMITNDLKICWALNALQAKNQQNVKSNIWMALQCLRWEQRQKFSSTIRLISYMLDFLWYFLKLFSFFKLVLGTTETFYKEIWYLPYREDIVNEMDFSVNPEE